MAKIAFIGSHGVGKTTLAYKLGYFLKMKGFNVDLVAEVARTSPLPINEDTTLDAQLWILCTQIKREIESSSRFDITICDRSVLDNYAYYYHANHINQEKDPYPSVFEFVFDWVKTYDLLLFIEPDLEIEDDGVRSTDKVFQEAINKNVELFLSHYEQKNNSKLPVLRLRPTDLKQEGSLQEILENITSIKVH